MKKLITSLSVSLLLIISANAQRAYNNDCAASVGLKFYPKGVSYKQAVARKDAMEFLAYFISNEGSRFTALYEVHHDIGGLDGLKWYIGPGAHVSFYDQDAYSSRTYLGVDGVIGLDLKFNRVPLNFSFDWQPSFDFNGGRNFSWDFGGLSIRYVIK